MDIRDFQGLFKFKLIIPLLYILSWVVIFLGPSLFPVIYQRYAIFLWAFMLIKMSYLLVSMIVITYRTNRTLKGYMAPPLPDEPLNDYRPVWNGICDRYYAFILPSYKEDEDLIAETLSWIGSHSRAKSNYVVMLAMQRHEEGSDKKAQRIISQHRHLFRVMDYTCHAIRQFQHKGKASNVSWCVQHLEPVLSRSGINPDRVFLTILDADSLIPSLYIDKVEQYLDHNIEKQNIVMLCPPQIYTRNNFDVPIVNRVYDNIHSFAHMSNLMSCLDIHVPLSNYTLSYNLAKRIGYWDTCADAIGEDFHTMEKAFWKTHGELITVPIYVAFNQVNLQSGSYFGDIQARFWQAERHAQGVADVAYSLNQFIKTRICSFRALVVTYYIFECFAVTATLPWVAISSIYQHNILYHFTKPSPELYQDVVLSVMINTVSVLTMLCWIFYEYIKRKHNTVLYGKQNESVLRIIQYPLLLMLNMFFITIPVFIIATFRSLGEAKQYRVAEKVLNKERRENTQE